MLMPNTDQASFLVLAEHLRVAVESTPWPGRTLTASIGVSTMLAGTVESAALLTAADFALYHSKQSGRNRVTHSADLSLATL